LSAAVLAQACVDATHTFTCNALKPARYSHGERTEAVESVEKMEGSRDLRGDSELPLTRGLTVLWAEYP
jgi:hypothetical protein